MVHEGNKDEAQNCFHRSQKLFQEGDMEKALRFAHKANRLYPSKTYEDFIEILTKLSGSSAASQKNGNLNSNDQSESPENVRRRRTASPAASAPEYTEEQAAAVKKLKTCKDYYEILGVTKEATDSELRKAYKKLALQFHPDKNKAPGAAEAFKAVGNAFAVLTDVEKRKQYDLYGHEERHNSPSQSGRTYYHHYNDFSRGFEGDVTAEELFNMFFGGYGGGTNVYNLRRNGRGWERTERHRGRHESMQQQSSLSVFVQIMPLIVVLLISLASSFMSSDPLYSLSPTNKYNILRTTGNLHVNYYVKHDFATEYQGSLYRLEQRIEEDYVDSLRHSCYRERNYKESMQWRAKTIADPHLYRKAQDLKTPSCDSLRKLYS